MELRTGVARLVRAGGIIELRPRDGAANRHVGAQMLDRLEPADRPLELLAHLCIGRRHVARRVGGADGIGGGKDLKMERRVRSEEHTSELQSLMRNSYAVFCLKKKSKQAK